MRLDVRSRGFNFVALMITLTIIATAIAILLPALGAARRTAHCPVSNTQTRGIHQGFVTYAQSNKVAGQDGFFPGLDSKGQIVPDGEFTGLSGDGATPGARLWMMLEGNYLTPDYIVSPADMRAVEVEVLPNSKHFAPITPQNYSYAMQHLTGTSNESAEWSETLSTSAIVLSARAIGTGPNDISSVWTDPGSGDWRGEVVRNDNSTAYESIHAFSDTRYGEGNVNATDDLFADAPDADDAYLVHADATTAYSAE